MYSLTVILTYSQLYGSPSSNIDPIKKLSNYHREELLLFLIAIKNCFDFQEKDPKEFKIVRSFYSMIPIDLKFRIMKFSKDQDQLVSTVVINKLIVDVLNLPIQSRDTEHSLDEAQFASDFFEVLLIYNDKHYQPNWDEDGSITPEKIWDLQLRQNVNATNDTDLSRTATVKHMIFDKFLSSISEESKVQIDEYLKLNYGLDHFHQLNFSLLQLFAIHTQKMESDSYFVIIDKQEPIYNILIKLGFIIDYQNIRTGQVDIGRLLSSPFLKCRDESLVLIGTRDLALIIDKIWKHFLYKSKSLKAVLPSWVKTNNDFLNFLGKNYYEEYLIGKIFRELDSRFRRVLITDNQFRPDITIVVNETYVYLIEVKSVSIHYKTIDEKSVNKFKDFIDDNFAKKKNGAAQLANSIKYLADESIDSFGIGNRNRLTVFPIIVYTESHLRKPAVNRYVNEHFTDLVSIEDLPFKKVHPLVMIHYDFFLENLTLISKSTSILKNVIEDYYRYIRKKEIIFEKYQSPQNYLECSASFDDYVIGKQGLYRVQSTKIFRNMVRVFALDQ